MKRLKKLANTKNIHLIDNETSINYFKDLYNNLISWGFKMFNSNEYAPHGCFVYSLNNDTLYLIEIYYFVNEYTNRNLNEMASQIGKHISVLVEYQIDETGNFDFITVQRCNGFSWKEIFNDIQSGVLLLDCCNDYTYLDTDDFNYGYQLGKKLINK